MIEGVAGVDYAWFSVFVVINSLLLFFLAANVSRLRLKYSISLGDAGNRHLNAAIRAHCNGLEQVPIFALLILSLTFLGAQNELLAVFVVLFSTARVAHAVGMLWSIFVCRRYGAGLTYLLQLAAIIWLALTMAF